MKIKYRRVDKTKKAQLIVPPKWETQDLSVPEVEKLLLRYDLEIISHTPQGIKKGKKVYFYQQLIYEIGGIETFLYQIAVTFPDYDITVVYHEADPHQLLRLAPYVSLLRFIPNKDPLECDVLIINNYHLVRVLDMPKVKYKKAYQVIHADFRGHLKIEYIGFDIHPKVNGYIAVSKSAQAGLKEVYGLDSVVIYNFINTNFLGNNELLKLITLSRATKEKGIDKVLKMAQMLKEKHVNFLWFLCGTIEKQLADGEILRDLKAIPEIVFIPPSITNQHLIPMCDYVIQLSKVESYGYSLHEALAYKVPIIVTDFPEAHNAVIEGVNGYILKQDLSNLDIDKIVNQRPKQAKYRDLGNRELWRQLFEKGELK